MNRKIYDITSDVFDIGEELSTIDELYHVVFNKRSNKYEIHYGWGKHSLQLVVKDLDRRCIKKVLSSRVSPYEAKALFAKVERDNLAKEQREKGKCLDQAKYQLNRLCQYLEYGDSIHHAYQDKWY